MKLIIVLFFFASCATIMNDDIEEFEVITNPPQAMVSAQGANNCVSPCKLYLRRGEDFFVKIEKEGYVTQDIKLG